MAEHRFTSLRRSALHAWLLLPLLALSASLVVSCKSSPADGTVADAATRDVSPFDTGVGKSDARGDGHAGASCSADGGPPSKGKGEVCACDSDCRTGYCADGVCCTSACGDTCKACNLPSALGDCSFVAAGAAPRDPATCKPGTPGGCAQDGTCDGKGACRLYVAGTVCNTGTCDGDGLSGVKTCDGKGACSGSLSRPCAPYSCDATSNRCDDACTSNAQCAAGQQCTQRSCGVKLNGFACVGDGDCASGHCSAGTCCNVACDGPCLSCSQTDSVGRCRFVPAGLPDPGCTAQGPATCGTTGLCDGSGACALYPENTPCVASACSGPVLLNTAAVCDGKGVCGAARLVDCAPYLCAAGACNGSCKSDADCEPGHACVPGSGAGGAGSCGKKNNGQSCSAADECDSGQCVDGVCCESGCQGPCRSCALPGSPGQCVDVAAGAPDPRRTCSDDGVASCGHDGVCDGKGACAVYSVGSECGPASCKAGAFTAAATCNQTGQCVSPPSRTCSPFACNGSACFTSCTKDTDCASGSFCVAGSCGKKPNGGECSGAGECQSGFCAQGICCNTACTDACSACNLSASLGLCTAVPDGAPDPQELCKASAQSTCGTTGTCLAGACSVVAKGLPCTAAVCSSESSSTPASTCDGRGTCVAATAVSCGTFLCSASACPSTCSRDADCVAPNTCVNNSCGLKPNGGSCTAGQQCSSGVCSEGVCCDTACSDSATSGLCMSCKVSGKVGTCSPVPDGQADSKQRCLASNPGAGDCSNAGTCDGRGACRPWPTSTGCRPAGCTGSTFSPAANCDGAGHCSTVSSSSCAPYLCSATSPSCLTTCTSDADCVSGETCLKTNNQCGNKLANGQTCKANADCSSNVCSPEGVCCNTTCNGACQSCVLQSKVGTCSNIAANGTPRDKSTCAAGTTCGNTGKCDGAGGCQLTAVGTLCGNASCAPAVSGTIGGSAASESIAQIPAPTCDGKGTCQAGSQVTCGAYQCNANNGQCKTTCSSTTADCNALAPSSSDSAGGNRCIGSTCQKQANGAACAAGFECVSGNCVDGVCCGTPSCAACMACNLANTSGKVDGTCRAVAAGSSEPHGLCTATASAGCGTDGKCTAAGACELWSGSTCTPDQSVCADSHHMVAATGTCNGSGKCSAGTPVACATGYLCAGGQCATTCSSDAACDSAAGYACSAGKCLKKAGQTCALGSECGSGNCVDGVCCTSSACGTCMACNLASAGSVLDGVCRAVGSGNPDPHGACPTTASSSCGTDGKCNGAGACERWSSSTCTPDQSVCADAGHRVSAAGTCNGSGVCAAGPPVACSAGYLCSSGKCATSCTTDASCDTSNGYACFSGKCLKKIGVACTASTDCGSGNCIGSGSGNVCCASACAEVACGSKALCQSTGAACQTHAGESCGSAACSSDSRASIAAGTCDGSGTCVAPAAVPCSAGYLCAGGQCANTCSTSSSCDVANGYQCVGASCKKVIATGQPCTADGDCGSGHCVSNGSSLICCATGCVDSACGSKAVCASNGTACQTHAGEACGTPTCSSDARSSIASTCNGLGSCVAASSNCSTGYLCGAGTCATSCSADTACDTGNGYRCSGGHCQPVVSPPDGGA